MQLQSLGKSIVSFDSIITSGTGTNQSFAKVLEGISTQEKINIVTRSNLTKAQKLGILATAGLSAEELKNVASTSALSTTQVTVTATTTGLGTALKGLWATMLANPLLIVGMAVTAGISAWNAYKQSVEEMRQTTSEAATVFNDTSSSIEDYANKYKALHDELTNANTTEERQHEIKSNLLSLQQELNDKYGEEYGKLNLVTDAYKDQTEAILAMNKAAAQTYLNQNVKGIEDAQKQMTTQRTYSLFGEDINAYSDAGKDIIALAKQLGFNVDTEDSGSFTVRVKADATDAYDKISDFMNQVASLQDKYGKDDSTINTMLGVSSEQLNKAKNVIDEFSATYNQSLIAEITSNDKLASSYTDILNAVKEYNDALSSGDESKILSARDNLRFLKSSIDASSDDWGKYRSVISDTFAQADTGLYDFNDALKSNQDNLMTYAKSLKGLSQEDLLAMNNDGQEDNFDKLVASAKEYGLSAEDVISILQKLKIVQTDVGKSGENVFPTQSKQDVIANINSLSEGFESLDKIMSSMKGKNPFDYALLDDKKFKDTFSGLDDVYTDFVEKISSSPKDIKANQEAFNSLLTAWIDSSGVLNNLSDENANLATSMLKNMGITNAEEVVTNRLAIAHEKLAAEKYYNENASDSLYNATMSEIDGFVNEGIAAGISEQAMSQLALEKLSVNDIKIDTASDIDQVIALANAAGASTSALDQLARAKSAFASINNALAKGTAQLANPSIGSPITAGLSVATELLKSNTMAELSEARKTLEGIANGTFDYDIKINSDDFKKATYGGGTKSNKAGSNKKDKEETTKDIDWIERRIKLLEEKRSELKTLSDNSYIDFLGLSTEDFNRAKELLTSDVDTMIGGSEELITIANKARMTIADLHTLVSTGSPTESKENYFAQILELDKTMLDEYSQSIAQYQNEYDKSVGKISAQNKAKIERGDMSIDTLSDKEAKDVQEAMDNYDKLQSLKSKQYDMQTQYLDDIKAKYDNISSSIKSENKQLENSSSIINAQIDYMQASGQVVGSSFYERLMGNTEGQIANARKSISNLRAEMKDLMSNGVSKDSEEYVDLKSEISEAEESLYSLKKAQEEYNNQLLQMPIDNMATIVSMYGDISDAMQDYASEVEADGKKLNAEYYQAQISNGAKVIDQLKEQASLIEDTMDEYEVGSDNWQDLYGQLRSVNSEMSTMVINMRKFNEELLKMPLENIGTYSDSLQKVVDGLTGVQSEQDTVISAVTGAIQEQIDAINKLKDAENEEKQLAIDALQEKLDLLDKENELRKLQYDLEQKQYDLERIRGQKSVATVRDGEIVYESDKAAERQAEQDYLDAQDNMAKHKLQEQIDNMQEALENLNKGYDEQISKLEEISSKWSEISQKIKQSQDESVADSNLGTGWKDKVLSGNDSAIFNTFSGMYKNTADQLQKYQEQINSTNNIQSLLEDYIASYKSGEITYAEAVSGINGLLSQMNQKMSATDNLQNIFDYLGTVGDTAANADAILAGIQSGLKDTATELLKSLEQYNKNSGMISEYTSSWQQLTDNVSSMLDVLKEVRDALEDGYDRDDEDDRDNTRYGGGKDGSPGVPGRGEYVNSGPGVKKYAAGIKNGAIGTATDSDRVNMLKYLTTNELKNGEYPIIAHEGEAVLNKEQQDQLWSNMSKHYSFQPYAVDYKPLVNTQSEQKQMVVNLQYGDLSFPNVRNFDDAIGDFAVLTDQAIRQVVSKYK
ncbi:hypothetical protein [Clostridium sp. HBUAS56010]|uniref:hypothetical protein n=1 Tax=Clostridium sp. HBUAS56010 TaxID=2571127 RepID=UPI0011777162|nr:hypothetical protein [Clostridium sp. HBUAS56010]